MTTTDSRPAAIAEPSGTAAVVAEIYAAFGRGDVPAVLEQLTDDVAWDVWPRNFAQERGVTHLRPRRGPAEVAEFFGLIGTWTVRAFDVRAIIGDGRRVVADVHAEFDLPGGGRIDDEELHLWSFDEGGRVVAFRHYVDTAKHIAAHAGEDTRPR